MYFIASPEGDTSLSYSQVTFIILGSVLSILIIYILSNQEALKFFSIQRKNNRLEIIILICTSLLIAVLPYLLSFIIIKMLKVDIENIADDTKVTSKNIDQTMVDISPTKDQISKEIESLTGDKDQVPMNQMRKSMVNMRKETERMQKSMWSINNNSSPAINFKRSEAQETLNSFEPKRE